ncbi:UNVERIFIED_CONTAM: Notch 2 N-terminal-like protein [Trichonephila clavipes]
MNICQHGECHVLNEEPGYHCDCVEGYFGEVCDKFDPCSRSPCENFGVCRNISSNKYRCECLSGFSGQNCSEFNPCALRPSPCQHGGRCESTASHKYQCYCTKGFYGKTCQFFDPCSLDPCQNEGKCQNSSQVDYVCKCIPGYAVNLTKNSLYNKSIFALGLEMGSSTSCQFWKLEVVNPHDPGQDNRIKLLHCFIVI